MNELTTEVREQLLNAREAYDSMQITYAEYKAAKAIILESVAMFAELVTEPIQEG